MKSDDPDLRDWSELPPDEQLRLREAYGHYLDGLAPTCDPDIKLARFRDWLADRGVRYRTV